MVDFDFLGRSDFHRRLGAVLREGSVILEGPRGVGKSEVLRRFAAPKGWAASW